MTKSPNQSFIAKQLDLAPGTVSRALRHDPGIHPDTRERVIKLAKKLGYALRPRVKNITESEASYLGVLVQTPEVNWAQTRYLVGISEAAAKLNAWLTVHYVGFRDCPSVLNPTRQPPAMRDGRIKGICLIHRWPQEVIEQLTRHYACVSIVHFYPSLSVDLIDMNHRSGMDQLIDHLYSLGHRKIGFFGHSTGLSWSRARFAGYIEAFAKLGLPINPRWIIPLESEEFEERMMPDSALQDVIRLVQQQDVRAWTAANEWSAHVLVNHFTKAGLRVPEDVSVTGFDNTEIVSEARMPLTTITVSLSEIGAATIKRLRHRLTHPDEPQQSILFSCSLVPGKSTGPLKNSAAR
ncbi:MAG TPA: LacI family DNA-binding transcriptional regulator [Phycisphaerae bacterium]|nr:LacI family DNA-binding transcriptional regulator [Phycisphaerae bacterium]